MSNKLKIAAEAPPDRSEIQEAIIDDAAAFAEIENPDEDSQLSGFVILAFYDDGAVRTAGWKAKFHGKPVGKSFMEAWAQKAMDDHFQYGTAKEAAFDAIMESE